MITVTIDEAQAKLPELIRYLSPGGILIITDGDRAVARLVGEEKRPEPARQSGRGKNLIVSMADDFDAPLEDLKEYME